jgi:hypothetical protein
VAKNNEGTPVQYHFSLQQKNIDTVRQQGLAINNTLKKLKRISGQDFAAHEQTTRDDEPTAQHVTIPIEKPVDLSLKDALEDAQAQCRKSEAPPPSNAPKAAQTQRKRWFNWKD